MATKKRKKKASKDDFVVADFGHKDAKGGGGRNPRLPEGDYLAKIVSAEKKEAKSSGNTYIKFGFKILEGKYKGKELSGNATLTPKALFWLRNMLEAMGQEVPEKASKIRYKKYIGQKVGITLEDDEYEGKIKSEVSDFIDPDMVGAADDEEEDEEDDDLDEDDEESDDDDDDDDDDDEDDEDEDLDEVDLDEL